MKLEPHTIRLAVIAAFFSCILMTLLWRMYDLTVQDRKFLQGQGDARSIRTVSISAHRGMITDRNGSPLAVSSPVKSAWINPKRFKPSKEQLKNLSKILKVTPKKLSLQALQDSDREFLYLKRHLSPEQAKLIKNLNIPGVNFQEEFKRFYPQGNSSAQLLGFTNVDDEGLEGIELAYQQWLMGISGKKKVVKDRLGRTIEVLNTLKKPRHGKNLHLSIDRRIQFFAFHALQNTIEQYGAKSGSIVVLDAKSGEVLAMANAPSFNPNVRQHFLPERYRNRSITDVFEPGSVMKPFSVASALESGRFTKDSLIDTSPSWMMVDGHAVRDIGNYGVLDVTGILQHSSNVGVTKMILASPPEQLVNLLRRSGIGQLTESGFPGEATGSIVSAEEATPFVLATLGFGYGLSLNTLQLAKSYLIFANQGRTMPVKLLHSNTDPQLQQVISARTANQVLEMLEAVVDGNGSGRRARVPGYRVAGKTGTSRIAGPEGYNADRHISSFVGIAPVSKPKLIVAVVIHEPTKGGYYGGAVAAPLSSKVMRAALRILDIQPDKPSSDI